MPSYMPSPAEVDTPLPLYGIMLQMYHDFENNYTCTKLVNSRLRHHQLVNTKWYCVLKVFLKGSNKVQCYGTAQDRITVFI